MKIGLSNIVTLSMLAILLTACGAKSEPTPGVVPDDLQTMEAQAEDIMDIVLAGEWTKVTADVEVVVDTWSAYQPQAPSDGATQTLEDASDQALANLQSVSTSQDAAGTMQGANDLSDAVIDLYDLYHPAIPTDVGRLDVLERQVILDVAAGDYTTAANTFARTKAIWEKVKPSVLDHSGKDAVGQFDASLSIQKYALQARDASALTAEARSALELVDVMEQLY